MIIKPEKLKFETEEDLIDYVTKGLPPTRSNFNKVIGMMNQPEEDIKARYGSAPISTDTIPNAEDRQLLEHTLNRVYENRVRDRNITLFGIVGLAIAGIIFGGIRSHSNDSSEADITDDTAADI